MNLIKKLKEFGLSPFGTERFYSGYTGEPYEEEIFIGPMYYFILMHLAVLKSQVRGESGPKTVITRQPLGGKRRHGGVKIGEMEKDALFSAGLFSFINQKMITDSDGYEVFICNRCGHLAIGNERTNYYYCKKCDTGTYVKKVIMPFATLLEYYLVNASNIGMKFSLD